MASCQPRVKYVWLVKLVKKNSIRNYNYHYNSRKFKEFLKQNQRNFEIRCGNTVYTLIFRLTAVKAIGLKDLNVCDSKLN